RVLRQYKAWTRCQEVGLIGSWREREVTCIQGHQRLMISNLAREALSLSALHATFAQSGHTDRLQIQADGIEPELHLPRGSPLSPALRRPVLLSLLTMMRN